jgi:hypothetical protein
LLRTDNTELRCGVCLAGHAKLNTVKDVEKLGAELHVQFSLGAEREVFESRKVPRAKICSTRREYINALKKVFAGLDREN